MKKFPNAGKAGFKIILALIIGALIWNFFSKKPEKNKVCATADLPVCEDAVNVQVIKEQPEGRQKIQENCLSGIVRLPLNVRFISDAPGWAEYWFITPNGYRVFKAEDNDVNFPRTTLPGSTFRIRGKAGMAKIQLELPPSKTRKSAVGDKNNTPVVPTVYSENREKEKKIREIKKEIEELKRAKKLRKKLEKLKKKLKKLNKLK